MTNRVIQIAAKVLAAASREHPADAVLRQELKNATGISRDDGRSISEAVFAYFRWLGWLNDDESVTQRIGRALELSQAFRKNPESVTAAELRCAIPNWAAKHVEVSEAWLRSLQTEPKLWLRARPGKGQELAAKLGHCTSAGAGPLADSLRYDGTQDLFRTEEFRGGEFELQDLNSQMVGLACDPQPGETWWDACAGAGGKMLHLCDLMQGRGLVWASDRAEWRLQQLKRRAARARIFNYRSVVWKSAAKLPTKTKFDGILVDAPCSGVGTWQRNPHARWTTRPEDVVRLAGLQESLLTDAATALKPGGKLIYSVCTLTRMETSDVAAAITRKFPELKPLELRNPLAPNTEPASALWLRPQETGGNGMFVAGWQK